MFKRYRKGTNIGLRQARSAWDRIMLVSGLDTLFFMPDLAVSWLLKRPTFKMQFRKMALGYRWLTARDGLRQAGQSSDC